MLDRFVASLLFITYFLLERKKLLRIYRRCADPRNHTAVITAACFERGIKLVDAAKQSKPITVAAVVVHER